MTQFPGFEGGKKLPRALLDQLWAVRARGRRLLKDKRAGRMRVPGPRNVFSPAEPAARSAENGVRCGAGEDGRQPLNGERKPRRGRGGLGPVRGRSCGQMRGPARSWGAARREREGAGALASALLGRAHRRAYWKRAGSGSRSMKSGSTGLRYCCQH